jgi:hypothetical protein
MYKKGEKEGTNCGGEMVEILIEPMLIFRQIGARAPNPSMVKTQRIDPGRRYKKTYAERQRGVQEKSRHLYEFSMTEESDRALLQSICWCAPLRFASIRFNSMKLPFRPDNIKGQLFYVILHLKRGDI